MHDELLGLLNHLIRLTPEEEKYVKSSFTFLKLQKGDFFLQSNNICKYVGFLKKGLVRYFVIKNDEESTFEFTKEGDFVADYTSFMGKQKSMQNIEAIEDCELLVIDHEKLNFFYNNTPNGNYLGRLVIEHRFNVMANTLLSVYMQNSEQRYQKFLNDYADLTQRIPQYHIASYVGVQPPSLSRIRRRILNL